MNYASHVTGSRFFRYKEFLVSRDHPDLAAAMSLSREEMERVAFWCQLIGDPFRIANPDNSVIILNGKRSEAMNNIVGGAKTSDHLYAIAADCHAIGMSAEQFFCALIDLNLPYRQIILYQKENFVHISVNCPCKSVKHQSIIKA